MKAGVLETNNHGGSGDFSLRITNLISVYFGSILDEIVIRVKIMVVELIKIGYCLVTPIKQIKITFILEKVVSKI